MSIFAIRLANTVLRAMVSISILFLSINSTALYASEKVAASTLTKVSETALSISAVLDADKRLKIFTTVLKSSDVWHYLEGSKATLFIVTDAALRSEGSAFLLEIVLLKQENAERRNKLMAYHLVPNRHDWLKHRPQ